MKTDFVKAFAFSVAFAAAAFVGSTGAAVAGGPSGIMAIWGSGAALT